MFSLKEMIKLVALFLCCSVSLSDWMEEYNNDTRPLCPKGRKRKHPRDEGRIVGGIPAGRKRFPFAVGLLTLDCNDEMEAKHIFCGGTLITDRHVLTATHCVYPITLQRKESIRATVGDYDIDDRNEVTSYLRKIDTIHHHPDYPGRFLPDSDLAILTLDEPIPLDGGMKVPVLPPLGRELINGTRCTILGWGATGGESSSILLKLRIPIVAREDCEELMPQFITPNMICAGGKQGKGSCLGDSGGSLLSQVRNVDCLVGISSFNFNDTCGLKGIPTVYVDVAKFTDWIYKNTKNASCKPRIIHRNRSTPIVDLSKNTSFFQKRFSSF